MIGVSSSTSLAPQFDGYAKDVFNIANDNAVKIIGVAQATSTSLTSHEVLMASYSSDTWPNVTLPNFDIRFTDANSLTGVAFLGHNPLITGDRVKEWISYSQANQGWIAQDWSLRDPTYDAGALNPALFYIHEAGESPLVEMDGKAPDLHYPMWHIGPAPLSAGVIGFDLYLTPGFTEKFDDGIVARHTLLSGVVNLTGFFQYLATENKGEEPHSIIYEPVFSDFTDEANVTGFIIAGLPWEHVFADILPTGTRIGSLLMAIDSVRHSTSSYFTVTRDEWTYRSSRCFVWQFVHLLAEWA